MHSFPLSYQELSRRNYNSQTLQQILQPQDWGILQTLCFSWVSPHAAIAEGGMPGIAICCKRGQCYTDLQAKQQGAKKLILEAYLG